MATTTVKRYIDSRKRNPSTSLIEQQTLQNQINHRVLEAHDFITWCSAMVERGFRAHGVVLQLGLLLMAAPHRVMGQTTSVPNEAHVAFAQVTEQSAYLKGEWIGAPTALEGRQTSTISCDLRTHNCHEVSASLIGGTLEADDNGTTTSHDGIAEEIRASNHITKLVTMPRNQRHYVINRSRTQCALRLNCSQRRCHLQSRSRERMNLLTVGWFLSFHRRQVT